MSEREVENSLKWEIKCHECEANLCGKGVKSISSAEKFATEHADKTGHKKFEINVFAHSIIMEVMEGACGKNWKKK